MGRRTLLKRQQPYGRGRLSFATHANSESHEVLARLSPGCPPLWGRFPTRYAPVCRYPLAGIARLACLIHAASVRSEPGSNSPSNKHTVNRSGETLETSGVGQHVLNCQRAMLKRDKKRAPSLEGADLSKEVSVMSSLSNHVDVQKGRPSFRNRSLF